MKILFVIVNFLFTLLTCIAQERQGVITDMINDKKSNFNYTIGNLLYDNNYLTRYIVNEKSSNPLKKILLNYDKNSGLIEVTLYRLNQKDTIVDKYNLFYHDSLALIFTQRRTVTELLKGPYEMVLCFKDSSKTFLEVLQIMNQSTVYKKHYLFRLLTSADVTSNVNYIKSHPVALNRSQKPIEPTIKEPTIVNNPTETKPNEPKSLEQNISQNAPKDTLTKNKSIVQPSNTIISSNSTVQSPVTVPAPSQTSAPINSGTNPMTPNKAPVTSVTTSTPTQVPSTKPPTDTPKPAPVVSAPVSSIFSGKLDSIECLIIPASHEMILLQVIVKGGVANYPFLMQGIEPLLLHLLINGATKSYTVDEIEARKNALMIHTELVFESDYSAIQYEFPRSSWNDAMKLIGEQLGKPAFEQDDIEEAKGDVSMGALTAKGDIWQQYRTFATQQLFFNQPYGKTPWGEGLNMAAITTDALKKYYTSVVNRNNIEFVLKGNISSQELRNSIKTNFRWMTWGNSNQATSSIDINTSTITYVKDEEAIAIATCLCNAPKASSNDYAAFLLSAFIIEDKIRNANNLKKNIEELHVLVPQSNQGLMFIQFTAADADKSMQLIIDEIKKLKKSGIKSGELNNYRQQFITSFYLAEEDEQQWNTLLTASAFYSSISMLDDWESVLQKIGPADIQSLLNRYVKAFRCYYSGDSDTANPLIFTQRLD